MAEWPQQHCELLLLFLNGLHQRLAPEAQREKAEGHVIIFARKQRCTVHMDSQTGRRGSSSWMCHRPIPFSQSHWGIFPALKWKVYDHRPHDQRSLQNAMGACCGSVSAEDCQGWRTTAKCFYPALHGCDAMKNTQGQMLKCQIPFFAHFSLYFQNKDHVSLISFDHWQQFVIDNYVFIVFICVFC